MVALKNIVVFGAAGSIGAAIVNGLVERKNDFSTITAITRYSPLPFSSSFTPSLSISPHSYLSLLFPHLAPSPRHLL
jgi:hypothetical protein